MEETELLFKEHVAATGIPLKEEIFNKVKFLKSVDTKTLTKAVSHQFYYLQVEELKSEEAAELGKQNLIYLELKHNVSKLHEKVSRFNFYLLRTIDQMR